MKDEAVGLTVEEICKRNESSTNLLLHLKNRKSLLVQKAKLRWLKDEDANSKLVQKSINARRMRNGLAGLEAEETWIDEPRAVKFVIKEYFQQQFRDKSNWT